MGPQQVKKNYIILLAVCIVVVSPPPFNLSEYFICQKSLNPRSFKAFFVFCSQVALTFFAAFNMIYIHLAYEKSTFTKANAPRLPVAHGLKLVVQLIVEGDLFRPVGGGYCIVTNK